MERITAQKPQGKNQRGEHMGEMKHMTLALTAKEMAALEELAAKKGLNKTALLRQALRLYQLVDANKGVIDGERIVLL